MPNPFRKERAWRELTEKANTLEKELARTVSGFGESARQINWQEVQSKLQPGEAAVEFVHYQFFNPERTDSTMYAALLLRPGHAPLFISLFEEKSLDALLKKEGTRRAEYVNHLYVHSSEPLYDLIWKPLEKELAGVQTIHYSPSGLLHLINIGALPTAQKEEAILSDRYQLRRLNSTRELVTASTARPNNPTAVLYGGIRYEADGMTTSDAHSEPLYNTSLDRGYMDFSQADSTLRGDRNWEYLPSTKEEVSSLETILKNNGLAASSQTAFNATEESFKALRKTAANPFP